MDYVAQIVEAGRSSKEKTIKHSRDRNINLIVTKIKTQVGLIRVKVLSEN